MPKLLMSPVLSFPNFSKDFQLETDASIKGLGAVLSQRGEDGKSHSVAYASTSLSPPEQRYAITELETLAVVWAIKHFHVWAIKHFHVYLYGHQVTVYTDHSDVKAVLQTPNLSGKHACWWSQVYGSGIKNLEIIYRAGKDNTNADALSRNPVGSPRPESETITDVHVSAVQSVDLSCDELLCTCPATQTAPDDDELASEQRKDAVSKQMLDFLLAGDLPDDPNEARRIAALAPLFAVVDNLLYFIGPKSKARKWCVVPEGLRRTLIEGHHSSPMAGHF